MVSELAVRGFWSYVHDDDATDDGRILQLAEDLKSEFAAITGNSLRLFVDRTSLEWGDDWRAKIDEAIVQATFLIPVVTPRYFKSQACRDEIRAFAAQAQAAGVPDLVLPVYWIVVRELESDPSVDEVTALVADRQRQDLRAGRLEDRGSSIYRQAVNQLAAALADRSERVASASVDLPAVAGSVNDPDDGEDGPGLLETLGEGEVALGEISPIMVRIGAEIETIGTFMEAATAELARADARGQGFKGRVRVAAKLAVALKEPSGHIAQLGQEYGGMMVKIDPMVRMLIDAGKRTSDPEEAAAALELFEQLRKMVDSSEAALESLGQMVESAKDMARTSSTMRPVLRELNRGLQGVLDSSTVFAEWMRLLDDDPDDGLAT